MAEEPERIRNEIESTRSDLARNVDALADRTIPTRVARSRWSSVKRKVRGMNDTLMGTPRHAAHPVQGSMQSAMDTVQDKASLATGKAGEVASDVTDTVRQAPEALTRQTQGNPIAAGMIAFGVGLLAASVIPTTDVEKRAGRQLKDNAGDLVEPVRQPLAESAQHLKNDLTGSVREAADRVKETAKDATQRTTEQARSSAQNASDQIRP
jgi:hypothetical protein